MSGKGSRPNGNGHGAADTIPEHRRLLVQTEQDRARAAIRRLIGGQSSANTAWLVVRETRR